MAAKKRVDPIKQREKRAKIAAAAGCVLLLIVAAFEVPKIMALMNKKPVVPPPTAVQPTAGVAGSLPDVSGGTAVALPPGELADTDLPSSSAPGQLVSFDVFETKDPFRPQVTASDLAQPDGSTPPAATDAGSGASPAPSTPATTTPSSEPPAPSVTAVPPTGAPDSTTPPTTSTPGTPTPPAGTAKPLPTVSISVNGVVTRVGRDGTFPSGKPVFRLVSYTDGEARIGIVGGSYSTGDPTLKLTVGKSVTLQNTSDGQRYRLVLLSTP